MKKHKPPEFQKPPRWSLLKDNQIVYQSQNYPEYALFMMTELKPEHEWTVERIPEPPPPIPHPPDPEVIANRRERRRQILMYQHEINATDITEEMLSLPSEMLRRLKDRDDIIAFLNHLKNSPINGQ